MQKTKRIYLILVLIVVLGFSSSQNADSESISSMEKKEPYSNYEKNGSYEIPSTDSNGYPYPEYENTSPDYEFIELKLQ